MASVTKDAGWLDRLNGNDINYSAWSQAGIVYVNGWNGAGDSELNDVRYRTVSSGVKVHQAEISGWMHISSLKSATDATLFTLPASVVPAKGTKVNLVGGFTTMWGTNTIRLNYGDIGKITGAYFGADITAKTDLKINLVISW